MENLQDKYTRALNNFEPEQKVRFLEVVDTTLPKFNKNLDDVVSELGLEVLQEPILLPFGSSLAKSKMRLIFYIKSLEMKQPLKIDLGLTSYLSKQIDQRVSYLKSCITKSISKVVTVKIKQEKPLHVRFEEMLATYKKGFQITPTHLETLGKVNKIIRYHSLKLFGNIINEPTIYDYCYGSKVTLNEIINIIKESELNTNP
ncbi:hypothetical protein P3573_13305 [Vibrio parahaemolyticus]|nr:hypothetical protein [Vibrio parahaemolyticus]MDF4278975.1 hypothetical protein [Vibrio parahaemolyticus]MDF4969554.1 hypothetical protein [Vibrio parahaemolyticus]MDG2548374.1 hypothetical protein [Vibrio parahaemolyticus]MDG2558393.1 hypothetical protein [Vibrio parahaemolyticus]